MLKFLLKLLKYACCGGIAFMSLVFIVGPISDASKTPSLLIFPLCLVVSGYYTYTSAKNKALKGSGFLWWLYGMFVPFISWFDVAKSNPIQAVTVSEQPSKINMNVSRNINEYHVKWETWEMEHDKPEQRKRWMKASKDCSLVKILDSQQGVAIIRGNRGGEYTTSLVMCSCPDFAKRHKPCKHMYFLAHHLGVFDPFNT